MTKSGGKTAGIARHKAQWHREYGQLQDKAGHGGGEECFFSTGETAGWGLSSGLAQYARV